MSCKSLLKEEFYFHARNDEESSRHPKIQIPRLCRVSEKLFVRRLYFTRRILPGSGRLGEGHATAFFHNRLDTSEAILGGPLSASLSKTLKTSDPCARRGAFCPTGSSFDTRAKRREQAQESGRLLLFSERSGDLRKQEAAKVLNIVLRDEQDESSLVLARFNGDSIRVISKRLGLSPKKFASLGEGPSSVQKALKAFTYKAFEGL